MLEYEPKRIDDVYRIWFSKDEVVIEKKECYALRNKYGRNDYLESRVVIRTITIYNNLPYLHLILDRV